MTMLTDDSSALPARVELTKEESTASMRSLPRQCKEGEATLLGQRLQMEMELPVTTRVICGVIIDPMAAAERYGLC